MNTSQNPAMREWFERMRDLERVFGSEKEIKRKQEIAIAEEEEKGMRKKLPKRVRLCPECNCAVVLQVSGLYECTRCNWASGSDHEEMLDVWIQEELALGIDEEREIERFRSI